MFIKKKIAFIVTLAAIAGSIWYLESVSVHPGAVPSGGAPSIAANTLPPATVPSATSSSVPQLQSASADAQITALAAADEKAGASPAREIQDPTGFVNTSSGFKLASLVGKKVILLDFWTYSCINCIRTIPYLAAWDVKYKNEGLEIVGIHTPEFDFEKDINNVRAAVQKFGIAYPVVLDSNYGTWQAYGNLYWPHEYLIDMAGYIAHDQIGEGNYGETETEIQKLLAQRAQILGTDQAVATSTVNIAPADLSGIASPETYFGAARNVYLANGSQGKAGAQELSAPSTMQLNALYLSGSWDFEQEYAENTAAGAKIFYLYKAPKVNLVASASSSVTIEVLQDGKPVDATNAGSDVRGGKVIIQSSRLYNIVNNTAACSGSGCADFNSEHTLELIIDNPGLNAYTFTFG
ncbi:MAG TPA: redoxin family protein [Candidatus Paceibacterota bacterium]|nr:redoxin family protein [Candidatus Paceibacterota bacterium]